MNAFRDGLHKVASVIVRNEMYDNILGLKLAREEYRRFEDVKTTPERLVLAMELLNAAINENNRKIYDWPDSVQVVAWAKTRNNRKELALFETLMRRTGVDMNLLNISDVAPRRFRSDVVDCTAMRNDVEKFYENISSVSKSLVFQHVQYIHAFKIFSATFPQAMREMPRLAFLANDHSPIPVALSMIMKQRGIPRVYFQHAEITCHFPALDFEYSVLRSESSLDLYREIGPVSGKTYIVSRAEKGFEHDRILSNATSLSTAAKIPLIVIYTTAVFNAQYSMDIYRTLSANPDVGKVLFKLHPGTGVDQRAALSNLGDCFIDSRPDEFHIGIVGNSSVVSELLSAGIPVWQDFQLDAVPRDYYGFVSRGLVPEFQAPLASSRFWQNYVIDDGWFEAFSKIDPSARTQSRILSYFDEVDFGEDAFRAIVGDGSDWSDLRLRNTFRRYLLYYTVAFLNLLSKDNELGFDDHYCLSEAETAFADRDPRLVAILDGVDFEQCGSALAAWLLLKKVEWTGFFPSDEELQRVTSFVYALEGDRYVVGKLENMLLSVLIRCKNIPLIRSFFRQSRFVRVDRLHINRRIALYRLVMESGSDADLGFRLESLVEGLSDLHKLKLEVQAEAAWGDSPMRYRHRDLELRLQRLAPRGVVDDWCRYVQPVFDMYRENMKFMDVQWCDAERSSAKKIICEKIQEGRPFAFVRLSDGEGYIFKNNQLCFTEKDALNRERHWWGVEISEELRSELETELISAVLQADVLGIPSVYRFLRDTVDTTTSIRQSLQGRGLLEVLNGIRNLHLTRTIFAEDKLNLALFTSAKNLRDFSAVAKGVLFVGSARREEIEPIFAGCQSFEYIAIPTHFKTRGNAKYHSHGDALPYVYKDVIREIDSRVSPGVVVFVAGGIVGKIFVARAKSKGGVALDLGSALDQLVGAGIHSLH
ncbi:MAG TPA: hypothetical protein PKW52_07680 [Nitrospira sp.]|uniref:hypothetical protein n=1 Tax=Cognatazoarcus halotolerans TaxID=2686016 RepID=UPI001358540F|nr:hypothetical protein [Cognatazoarcus halotolerans]MCB1902106.1 hypothetical protein [Rhodocyclaceae bacterium]MCP5311088.1 hypothetical protein [Zoogloeaceae bacterium]HQV11204.1 hypothetical protein [Nitrospira sp.]